MVKSTTTDVLVIGAGLAGLMAALRLAPKAVTLLSKGPLGQEASSTWAQGGISAALDPADSPASHLADTLAVAGGIADEDIAALVTDLGPERIRDLIDLGVIFDHNEKGLSLSREAAHSHRRVVHANGDSTGREVMRVLQRRIQEAAHITVLENAEAIDLLCQNNQVFGATLLQDNKSQTISADATIIATGGIGQIYSATTNPFAACGDGLAMAARAGAKLKDLEFVQFHPTAIDVEATPRPLATEALRGDGAWLVNETGKRFMEDEHPLAELAPRDVVARGIWRQIQKGHRCYLDCRKSIGKAFPEHFPTVYAHCENHDIDPVKDLIPVVPAAHYHMGGIETDNRGRTNLGGLWVCGEAACTGLHGANRLASNSLLEALVFAPLVSKDVCDFLAENPARNIPEIEIFKNPNTRSSSAKNDNEAIHQLQTLNYCYIGLCRDENGLKTLLKELDRLEINHPHASTRLRNIMTVSCLIATTALERKESRGGHYRLDYPESDPQYQRHSTLKLNKDTKDVATDTTNVAIKLAS
ncbi:L-aspartate oxidase [Kiloniella majae]|uniref:L-aspartate oxidase n=1 Tax=Kiloniella majae TaxID=1938558 RepID=UPI000A2783DB|nr:L-aspartate oxidase [Kiloniella majae]